jgi:type IV pilus assembly protein PilM
MPLDINDIYFDWQPIKTNAAEQSVLVGASPKYIVDSYFNILTKAGLTPIALEIEAASIARLLIEHNGEPEPQIIIDMGASRTGLFLYDEGMIKFTISLPISGDLITQLIAESLEMDKEKSEKAKIVCGLDRTKCHGALLSIMGNALDELAEQINKAVIFYRANFANANRIEKLILCGGGANFLGIAEVLKEKTALNVSISDPLKRLDCPFDELRSPKIQSFISTLGLALRGLNLKNYL